MNKPAFAFVLLGCSVAFTAYAVTAYDGCYQRSCPQDQVLTFHAPEPGFSGPASVFQWCCPKGQKRFSNKVCSQATVVVRLSPDACQAAPCNTLPQCKALRHDASDPARSDQQ